MKTPVLLTPHSKWCTVNQNKHITKSLANLICTPLTSINHIDQIWQIKCCLFRKGIFLLLLLELYIKDNGAYEHNTDVLPNDQFIIQAVKQSSKHNVKSGKVWLYVLGSEPLFKRIQPDVMCHLLVMAYQNTSGHCKIYASAAARQELIVSFILPIANVARPSSFQLRSLQWAGLLLIVSVKCVLFTWVILDFICSVAELNVKVDPKNSIMVMVPRDWGESWEAQV